MLQGKASSELENQPDSQRKPPPCTIDHSLIAGYRTRLILTIICNHGVRRWRRVVSPVNWPGPPPLRSAAACRRGPCPRPCLQPRPSDPRKREPARRIFLKGNRGGLGRALPLRKTTSAACCPRPTLDRRGDRRGLPLMPFLAASPSSGGLRREKGMNGTSRLGVLGALKIGRRHRPRRQTRAPSRTGRAGCALSSPGRAPD